MRKTRHNYTGDRGNASQHAKHGGGRELPRGPLVPVERLSHRRAACAAAERGRAGPYPLLRDGQEQGPRGVPPTIAPGALQRLMEYNWPGNVRELENLVERELIPHRDGPLTFSTILPSPEQKNMPLVAGNGRSLYPLNLDEANAVHITEVLKIGQGEDRWSRRCG